MQVFVFLIYSLRKYVFIFYSQKTVMEEKKNVPNCTQKSIDCFSDEIQNNNIYI